MKKTTLTACVLTAAGLGISLASEAAVVGRVLLAAGEAQAVRDGKTVRLEFGSQVEDRDVLRTGPTSSLQIRFVDESFISLRENSQVAIEEYRFAGKEDGSESAAFALIKGGFRKVTGLIGRMNQKNYRVGTPNATIGIRGTDYAIRQCSGDCGEGIKDGLYGSVLGLSHGTNRVAVTNNAGESVFGKDEHFYVQDVNTRPQPLLEPPSFVAVKPQGKAQGQASSEQGGGSGEEKASASSGVAAESRPATVGEPPVALTLDKADQYQATETLTTAGTPAAIAATPTSTGGFAIAAEDFAFGNFFSPITQLNTTGTGATERLTSFSSSFSFTDESGTYSGSFGGAEGSQGSEMVGYVSEINAHYGRWIDGSVNFTSNEETFSLTPGTGVHWLYGYQSADPSVYASKSGAFQFNRIAGTRPTDSSGNIASSFTFGPMYVEFQHLQGVIRDMGWTIAGVSHSFSPVDIEIFNTGSGLAFFGTNDFDNLNTGKCVGGACGTGAAADVFVAGGFAGTAGDYAGMSIGSWSPAGTTSSVQVYHCPTCATTNTGLPLTSFGYAFAGHAPNGYDVASFDVNLNVSPYMVYSGSNLIAFDEFTESANIGSGSNVNTGTLVPINGGFGRWNAGTVTESFFGLPVTAPFNPGTGVHWMYGDIAHPEAVFTRTGIVNFGHITGTNPTDSLGGVGAFSGGNIAVNFTNLTAAMNATWITPGYTWSLSNAPLILTPDGMSVGVRTSMDGFTSGPLMSHGSTSCSGGCSTGPIQFVNVNGQFMGVRGDHIGTAISTFHSGVGTASVQVFGESGQALAR